MNQAAQNTVCLPKFAGIVVEIRRDVRYVIIDIPVAYALAKKCKKGIVIRKVA